MKWIPCKKRMPPDFQNVLVYYLSDGNPLYRVDYPIDGKFCIDGFGNEIPLCWMELPKPPKP